MSSTDSPYADGVPPADADRAREYPRLADGTTLGTICEHRSSGEWVIVTDLPDETWGDIFEVDDDRASEKVARFLNLECLPDAAIGRFESVIGCYQHAALARKYNDHEGAGNYVRRSDFHSKFRVLGPIHPDARGENE